MIPYWIERNFINIFIVGVLVAVVVDMALPFFEERIDRTRYLYRYCQDEVFPPDGRSSATDTEILLLCRSVILEQDEIDHLGAIVDIFLDEGREL